MRLTGGVGKGRKLAPVPSGVRPTSGRVKEFIFQYLQQEIHDARFLDLFAGTGAVGIEAIARGAREAVFIEKNGKALSTIKDNLQRCGFNDQSSLVRGDVLQTIRSGRVTGRFDVIFADPPYADVNLDEIVAAVDDANLLMEDGQFIIELAVGGKINVPPNWTLLDDRDAGDTRILIIVPHPVD